MSFKHNTVPHHSTKFAPLCRLYYRSHGIEIFSDLWSSLIVFVTFLKIKLFWPKLCHWNLLFAPKPEVCEMDGLFRLQNGLTLLSSIITSRSKSKKAHKMILTWCLRWFSKFSVIFRKTNFLGLRNKSVFQEISTFSVLFSLVDHIIYIWIKIWLKCV